MPLRISRASLGPASAARKAAPAASASGRAKAPRKRAQRSLNAFSIAGHEAPDRIRVRKNRLGAAEEDGDSSRRKRQRTQNDDDDEDGDEEDGPSDAKRVQRRKVAKGRLDQLDVSEGSDSEGNEWKMGVVEGSEDSDVDSDEAFGESDEEKFEGFTFRGSQKTGSSRKERKRTAVSDDINLEEEEEEEDEGSDGSLGEDAVDLATMLDDASDESEDEPVDKGTEGPRGTKAIRGSSSTKLNIEDGAEEDIFEGLNAGESASDEESADDESDESELSASDDEADERDPEKLERLRHVVASLPKSRPVEDEEDVDFDDRPTADSLLAALQGMPGLDAGLSRSIKQLARNAKSSKSGKADGLVKVPLPKRQQDRLDRAAAYEKAKETLNRWVDTVKHNRRAEHLSFPLADPHANDAQGTNRLTSTGEEAPRNELESAIQTILQESGLGARGGRSEEAQLAKAEELEAAKMPLEEVLARRAELRKQRDLLFREEVKAKRIKKIKSKAYRRVHRKEQERAAQKERDLMAAAGIELSEDEKERNDRRRAEERMGARHRESRWAKAVKGTGRAAWDEDARGGVQEMARRREELTRRMEGERATGASDDDDVSAEEEDDDDDSDDDAGGFKLRLGDQLEELAAEDGTEEMSKLGAMKFMQRANALQKQRNDDDIRRIQKELNGDADNDDDSEPERNMGRRIFGPRTDEPATKPPRPASREEFEERDSSDSEAGAVRQRQQQQRAKSSSPAPVLNVGPARHAPSTRQKLSDGKLVVRDSQPVQKRAHDSTAPDTNGWTTVPYTGPSPQDNDTTTTLKTTTTPSSTLSTTTPAPHPDPDSDPDTDPSLPPSNTALIRAAFGTPDDATTFLAEKTALVTDEADKVTDNALPGWGSWAGAGVSARATARAAARTRGRFLSVEKGVAPARRADARLGDKVIVSERRSKKNAKYLASTLPHPFESRAQYERSLRVPIGPEWTTKESFQSATKPRVLVRQGIIKPMERPVV